MFQCRFQPSAETPHSRRWPALYCVGSKDGMLTTVPHRLRRCANVGISRGRKAVGCMPRFGTSADRPSGPRCQHEYYLEREDYLAVLIDHLVEVGDDTATRSGGW